MEGEAREAELQELWANAYEGWKSVPGAEKDVLFLRPKKAVHSDVDEAPHSMDQKFPDIVLTSSIFAITAWNPKGELCSKESNIEANVLLKRDIDRWPSPPMRACWHGFGFDSTWREDGFVLAFNKEVTHHARELVVQLAVKYAQGAIYEYIPAGGDNSLRRKTVPAMFNNVDADTDVVLCSKPDFKIEL
mmetsp:Transcript_21488/g.29872  ORF Transcript_21488/g.29872 Transcript_21488/m.29872 type:complete len:190 (-) Transcript_21488:36-605(-)|eukprot:CAMPEP_0196591688 /NCGR_PEP_ID=MMETSP1081-20130531/70560_1 /TAXON_ID=36882 /ORGANISM="Pyramimonas amylifera, Strain CCMP720" /LENGTH=189 /DNA_ID=CAMNT_0041915129 /DNA_START=149 /DNA_END=718 /DNA_ORIENTATION=-